MNAFLKDNIYVLFLFLLIVILLLVVLISIVLIKILFTRGTPLLEDSKPAGQLNIEPQSLFKKLAEESIVEKFYCENHHETLSTTACLICENVFCEQCVVDHEGLYFCKEHFKIFASNKWKQITDIRTTPNTPNDGLYIYHFKRHIWKDQKIPSFVLTHYKINIEEDFIESFIQLNVIEEKEDELLREIENFKTKD